MTASARYCTFTVGTLLVGVEVDRVREIVIAPQIVPVPLASAGVLGLINRRGEIVTALDARVRFGADDSMPTDRLPETHVIVGLDGETVSFAVDGEGEVVEIAPESVHPVPETVPAQLRRLLRGVAELPDGRLMVDLRAERTVGEATP
jgi:purine-binding chemotaxis protein CheW